MALKELLRDKSVEKAAETIDALAERAKQALFDMAQRARDTSPEDVQGSAWRFASDARGQASDLASDLYARGQRTAVAVGRQVEEQPYMALLVVAIFGLMIGYALRSR